VCRKLLQVHGDVSMCRAVMAGDHVRRRAACA
jgi:hypothetical protein